MARMRTLKPEFWADEELAVQLTRDERMLYIGLWNLADEHGRLRGAPTYVKGQIFPYDDDITTETVDQMLGKLADLRKVVRYRSGSSRYIFLPNLGKHQRLDAEKVPSKLPDPDNCEPEQSAATPSSPEVFGLDQDDHKPETDEFESRPNKSGPGTDVSGSDPDSSVLLLGSGFRGQVSGVRGQEGVRADARDAAPSEHRDVSVLVPAPVDAFELNDALRRWANATHPGLDLDFQTEQFRRHYRSTGSNRRSWPDAWQKWIADSHKHKPVPYQRDGPSSRPESTGTARARDAIEAGARVQAMIDGRAGA